MGAGRVESRVLRYAPTGAQVQQYGRPGMV